MANEDLIRKMKKETVARTNKWKESPFGGFTMELLMPFDRTVYVDVYETCGDWSYKTSLMPLGGYDNRTFKDAESCKRAAIKRMIRELQRCNKTVSILSKLLIDV